MALAGAPRYTVFDEPAAGLSPNERSDLVQILTALPEHIGRPSSSTISTSLCVWSNGSR
ncbi:MAG: hypothetical protein R3E87_04710 [Burkholderiaceae bacterium]